MPNDTLILDRLLRRSPFSTQQSFRFGFVFLRQKGSHRIFRRGSVGCVVPDHKEIKVGTLAGTLRQAEVSTEDFLAALTK